MSDLFSEAARAQQASTAAGQRARLIELLEQLVALLTPDDEGTDD